MLIAVACPVRAYGRKGFHKGYNRQIMDQGSAACKPDGPSCARESGQELHLVDQQPRQDLRQLVVGHYRN
jgi:hypothetical protein